MAQQQRGQAIQIGAVLLFAILIILLSTYQAFVVPNQNEEIEFNHNQEVQSDMADLRNAIVSSTGSSATTRAVSLRLGTTYPSRSLFVNPAPPSGSLRTRGTASPSVNVTIDNATTPPNVTSDAGDFWTGGNRTYSTGRIVYRPNYNEYLRPPETVYENGIVYNRFNDANVTVTDQQLIDGDTINLVALNGSVSASQSGTASVDVRTISSSENSIAVTNVSAGSPVAITVPTKLTATEWNTLLSEEGRVVDVSPAGQTTVDGEVWRLVEIELEEDTTYTLRMSRVGVGTSVTRSLDGAYLQRVTGNGTTVPEDSNTTLVVEVRDEYNNPAAGELIEASATRGTVTTFAEADSDGRVELTYDAPSISSGGAKSAQVNVSLDVDPSAVGTGFNASAPRNVTFDLTVDNTDGSGTGGGGGDPPAYSIWLENATGSQMDSQDGVDCSARPAGECEYNFANDADDKFDLYATTDPTAIGANVDWSLNSTATGDFDAADPDGDTDSNGDATATFDAQTVGAMRAYVSSGQTSDDIVVELVDTSGGSKVLSATSPNPEKLSDGDGEFVRIYFPSTTDINGWTIEDSAGNTEQLATSTEEVSGEIYVARDKPVFQETWSLPASDVYEFNFALNNAGGDSITLKDDTGTVVDEFGYDGTTTSNGWSKAGVNNDGRVAYRTKSGGIYDDTDSAGDWQIDDDENVFFNTRGGSTPGSGMVFSSDVGGTPYMKSLDSSQRVGFFDVTNHETFTRMSTDFNGDGTDDVIYIDGSDNIRLTDHEGNDELLDSSTTPATSRLTIGDFSGDGNAQVYFIDKQNNNKGDIAELQYNGGSPTVNYVTDDNSDRISAGAVVGVGDVDTSSGTPELIYTSQNDEIRYITDNGNPTQLMVGGGNKPADTTAVSEPRDFDDDSEIEVAYYDGSDIRLADSSGTDGTLTTVSDAPIAPLELDSSNSGPEIVYVDGTGTLKYYAVGSGSSGTVTDEHGNTLEAEGGKGAV